MTYVLSTQPAIPAGALAAAPQPVLPAAGLELDHSTRNEGSCRVADVCGFVLEGAKRSSAVHADGRHDMHPHARIRDGGHGGPAGG